MRKKNAIRFDMEDISDISDSIIEIEGFHTKNTITNKRNQLMFAIPKQIIIDLQLNPGDVVYFCQYSNGYYLSFKYKPADISNKQFRTRKLVPAGMYKTLYICIPPFIKNLYKEPITNIKLVQTKGFQPHEWQIQFLSTECI